MDEITRLLKGELIGREISLRSRRGSVSLDGKIIDETKNTVVVRSGKKQRRIIKAAWDFEFALDGKRLVIDGAYFQKRPQDRIKTKLMKR